MYTDELCHHGILGQRWGVRRFQNEDGTRTAAGKKRYGNDTLQNSERKISGNSEKKKMAIVVGTSVTAASAFVIAKNYKSRSAHLISEMSSKNVSDIRQNATRGLDAMKRIMAQQQEALIRVDKAFNAVNAAARR